MTRSSSKLQAKPFPRRTPTGRYDLYELVRQYVADWFAQSPKHEGETRDGRCAYYTDYVARLEDEVGALAGARVHRLRDEASGGHEADERSGRPTVRGAGSAITLFAIRSYSSYAGGKTFEAVVEDSLK